MTQQNITKDSIYIRSLTLENVRTFGEKQTINFCNQDAEPALWNVIIGDNGSGKTSILRSLCCMYRLHYLKLEKSLSSWPDVLHRFNEDVSTVGIEFEYLSLEGGKKVNHFDTSIYVNSHLVPRLRDQFDDEYIFLLFGYGASRRIGTQGISSTNNTPAQTLFDDSAELLNAEGWLLQADYKAVKNPIYEPHNEKVKEIIKTLFQGEILDIKTDEETLKVLFETRYGWVRLHDLSLGYKTMMSWVVDFAKGMLEAYPESENPLAEPAICLVDEIDLHIHPSLQHKIIQFLSTTFSRTQFIVTAHSPLIVQAVNDANIILLKEKGNSVIVEQNTLDIQNWRIDQILMSDLFGLSDAYSTKTNDKLARRKFLLRKDSLTANEEQELARLNEYVDSMPIGNSQPEIEGFDLLRQFARSVSRNK